MEVRKMKFSRHLNITKLKKNLLVKQTAAQKAQLAECPQMHQESLP
jgi:hypothetical protein